MHAITAVVMFEVGMVLSGSRSSNPKIVKSNLPDSRIMLVIKVSWSIQIELQQHLTSD